MSGATPAPGSDSRRYERHNLSVTVYIDVAKKSYAKQLKLTCKDISAGGLSFETRKKLPLEASSLLVITRLGDLTEPVVLRARIAHREKNPATGRYFVGLEFVDFVSLSREALTERIQLWKSTDATPAPRP